MVCDESHGGGRVDGVCGCGSDSGEAGENKVEVPAWRCGGAPMHFYI